MLNGKTAVVTGASRGIGKAISLCLARAGADLALIYAGSKEAAEGVCKEAKKLGAKAISYQCNVADWSQSKAVCDAITQDFSTVDILVNNAGATQDNLIVRMSEEDFDAVIGVNLKGAFNFTRHLARALMKSSSGRIINITSVSGLMGNPGQANYSAAKAGVIGLTKTVAKELAARGVTCNAVAPGFIQTDMTASLPQAVKDYAHTATPLRRMGSADEVAETVAFLASSQSSYITGEVIRVDGGLCM
ncbi:MAG: 3-oxoacyl-[acyl-carrier-protein] reductase [Coriobacteriia bacterium]|nr:3-oxoacyl-[acyl-carrier-protein] reductase [Coriobacteriia bacterium]